MDYISLICNLFCVYSDVSVSLQTYLTEIYNYAQLYCFIFFILCFLILFKLKNICQT